MPRVFRADDGGTAATRVYRRDRAPLGKATRTETGFLIVPSSPAKTGPLEYVDAEGKRRIEIVLPEELFSEASLASLRTSPVVHRHPSERVLTAENARKLSVGYPTRIDRGADGVHVDGELMILDAETIRAIDAGERDLSPGYFCTLEPVEAGVYTMPDGQVVRADASTGHTGGLWIQRNRTHNHIAIEPVGRSGPSVAMRLDSAGDVLPEPRSNTMEMVKINIGGVEYEVPKAVAEAIAKMQAAQAEMDAAKLAPPAPAPAPNTDAAELGRVKAELATVKAQLDASKGEADALKAKAAQLQSRVDAVDQAEKAAAHKALCARVAAAIHQDAATLVALDAGKVKALAVEKLAPTIKLDGKSADYVDGVLEQLLTHVDGGTPTSTVVGDLKLAQRSDAKPDPRAAYEARLYDSWKSGAPKAAG